MYRKNLMRVCLAAIMAATVVTTSVPVYAAEPVATKQEKTNESEPAKTTVKINYYDEKAEKQAGEVEVSVYEGTTALRDTLVKENLPEGYELVNPNVAEYGINGGYVYVAVKSVVPEKPAKTTVKINYYDEKAEKQAGEVEVSVYEGTTALRDTQVKENLPEGYELVNPNVAEYEINGGYVYVAVKSVVPEKPAKTTVKINYYDEKAEKQAGEVEVSVYEGTTALRDTQVKENLPEGYELVNPNVAEYEINGGYVYVAVKSVTPENPAKTTVKINYYDEEAEKQAAEVEVSVYEGTTVLRDTQVKENLPEGYELVNPNAVEYEINGGYVYVAVKAVKKAEVKTTLNISFETKDGEVVDTKLVSTTVQGSSNDSWTFMLGTDFFLPTGYKLAEGVEQTTNIQVPFGATAGHTVVVEKIVNEKTVYVSYIDEETKMPFENGIEEIKVAADATSFNTSILTKVPAGYEVCVTGDIAFEGDTVNVEVRKAEKTVYVSYIDEETKMPFENGIEEIKVAADANSFNTSILKNVPEGYELCVVGDVAFEGDTVNVEVRKAEKTVYVSYIDEETKMPFENGIEEIKVAADANSFNTSILKNVPAGYELCVVGDIAFEGDSLNVEVRKAEKTVYVSYIDEETKMPFENGIEEIKVAKDATYFNTSLLKEVPAGYELCELGDVYIGENDTVNVEVRKLAAEEKTVYVSYIDEETKMPFENGIEEIKVAKDATYFNTSLLKEVPAGYELCELGDVYIGENDTVNVEVRKLAAEEKTVYVSYIDEETKMPFENGIETIKLAKNATYFNTSLLKEVPAGYELCEVGDVYIGENDTVNVEVRKIKEDPETPEEPDKPVNPEDPDKKPDVDDQDKDDQKDDQKDKTDKKDENDKKTPKTSDEASPLAATATAGLSLAAILALLKKRR